ncbi:MAG: amino acid permease [Halobacteria archaeon]
MGKSLERDLGLPSVMAISIGAMVGSGIFILPGLALKMAGPAVIAAYGIAALHVLPAALSKSEMATAMPESGGTYLYIERGMGPLLGTIAGIGTWFSLTFKGALALVGGAPYLVLLFELPVRPVAVGIGFLLIVINLVGVKQTGKIQTFIVVIMVGILTWFVANSAPSINSANYGNFFSQGIGGLLKATGFVFVSYAGVTKIASVAEEIEDPDRNIPLGMLGSLLFTTVLYIALVFVMVGVVPAKNLKGSEISMALAAESVFSNTGVLLIISAALIALISTANAGILSSSRYPLAMSRDSLAPPSLGTVSERFGTPVQAITLTGGVLLVMVAFLPIQKIAKLASAFKILVFILINIALIAFREADLEEYEPSFETPIYPLPQIFGIVGGLALIPLMGFIPLAGSVLIVAGSLVWYLIYVRRRGDVDREGAAKDAIRQRIGGQVMEETTQAIAQNDLYDVLAVVTEKISLDSEKTLIKIASTIAGSRGGSVQVTRFDKVPDQTPLKTASAEKTSGDLSFETRMEKQVELSEVTTMYGEIVSHDLKHSVVNHAKTRDVDALIMERRRELIHASIFGSDVRWIKRNADCDVIEVEDRGIENIENVGLVTDGKPYEAVKVMVADAIAERAGGSVELLYGMDPSSPPKQRQTIQEYLDRLKGEFDSPVSINLIEAKDKREGLIKASRSMNIIVISSGDDGLKGALFGSPSDYIIDGVDCTAVIVHPVNKNGGSIRDFLHYKLF